MQLPIDDDVRWQMVRTRDRTADGQFYYSVKTTGIYCRPSCAARLARRENITFHLTREAAESAGFRPCKRCQPDLESTAAEQRAKIIAVCRLIETAETPPPLKVLAERAGLSLYHFHRVFKSFTGVTPKDYADAHRARKLQMRLKSARTVTEAIYDAGYNSNGRMYAISNQHLGMTPSQFRSGGSNTTIRFAVGECFLGSFLVASTGKGVCAILLGDDPGVLLRELQDRFPQAELIGGDRDYEKLLTQVIGFIETPAKGLDLPLDIRGTVFQQRVWQVLREIPPGTTLSYSDIAGRLGLPNAVRAVAGACAANPIAIAIPCHRVVRKDGGLSGYYWGVERKRALLAREAGE